MLSKFVDDSRPRRFAYRLDQSPRFIVISSFYPGAAAKWPPFSEKMLDRILPFLAPIAIVPPWPIVAIFLHNAPTLDMYVSAVASNKGLMPGGMYIDGRRCPPHLAILGSMHLLGLRIVFIHELIHALIHHLSIPSWLEEGICRHLEAEPLRIHNLTYPSDVDLERNRYWKLHGLDAFWSGACFGNIAAHEAYFLAMRMVQRLLAEDPSQFFHFVRESRREDAGDAACRRVYGRPIAAVAAEFRGVGEWLPPAKNAENSAPQVRQSFR